MNTYRTREGFMTREKLANKFEEIEYLIDKKYERQSPIKQNKLRKDVGIREHKLVLRCINIGKRFTGKIRDQIIQKAVHWKIIEFMYSHFTDKQVMQFLQQIPDNLNSDRCALNSTQCKIICEQIEKGIPVKIPSQGPIKKPQPKQETFDDWSIDLDESLDLEEKPHLKDQIEKKVQDTYIPTRYIENRENPRLDELKEYKQFLQTALSQITEAIKDIKDIEDIRLRQSQQVEETQKKIQSNGHNKQTM